MIKKPWSLVAFLLLYVSTSAQDIDKQINKTEVEKVERTLSSDDMQGRKILTPGIEKAADFIENEFKKAGLQTWEGSKTFKQEFSLVNPKFKSISGTFNNRPVDQSNAIVVTTRPLLRVTRDSAFEVVHIAAGENLFREAGKYTQSGKNYLVLVDTSFAKNFTALTRFKNQLPRSDKSQVFVLTTETPTVFDIQASHEISLMSLSNVVGTLPGKSRKDEYVIFSAHYDHLGIGKPQNGDSIFNGANDDAAGTTAVIMLARYFKALNNNERTIVFATFTGEEEGGFGSKYFSRTLDPGKVIAMFNIEMIGTESKWGKNSAYITGYEKTDMAKILEKNVEGTGFRYYPDPYTSEQLFYRSDNATLARLGVPAHTISTSKMDSEKYYHTVNDEIETLDMDNMAMIIKAVAMSAKSIISGADTPSRVDEQLLR